MRLFALFLSAFALTACAARPSPPPQQVTSPGELPLGTWQGTVTEGGSTYPLEMRIERLNAGQYAGTTEYSGRLDCGGLLTFEVTKGSVHIFHEVIQRNNSGCGNGRIEVFVAPDGRLQWDWYREGAGGKPQATATLAQAK